MQETDTTLVRHNPTLAAREEMLRLVGGFQISQAIHAAVVLGLPDLLHTQARDAHELAKVTNSDQAALYRLMRALAAVGVVREDDRRRFELTAMGMTLRTDVARSLAPIVRLQCRSSHWLAWDKLLHAVGTGGTAFEHVHGKDVWSFRAEHRDDGDVFDTAMAAFSNQVADALLQVCDFSLARHVVDVGGGDGTLLTRILDANHHLIGTLFDQPHVVERARGVIDAADLGSRCALAGGDFFESVPGGGDVYLLKWILHDWDDAPATQILRSCRQSMTCAGRLVIVEHVLGAQKSSVTALLRDLQMLVVTGGRERTREEFATLLSDTGFAIRSVYQTTAAVDVIEAIAN